MRADRAGLSLLEVIFASFIFAGLVTLLSGIWVMHARAQRQTGMLLVAADLADLTMSKALASGYHDVVDTSQSFTQVWEVRGQEIEHAFTCQVEVSDLGTPSDNLRIKLIKVTVTYDSGSLSTGRESLSIESFVADEN